MEKRLLFINHREEEIKGFLEAMPEELKIDTADNGIDAALLMKKNTYGVIVVDMELKGYDGEQLIKFMNKVYPDTVCIVYTVAITQGQLSFLLNERNVFHVFLSPANFREEFYQMIEEGFVLYGVNTVNNQEADELEEKYPDKTPKEREDIITKEHGAVFIMKIGGLLASGQRHDGRSPDYDDWELNGDIILWNEVLDRAFELSSMGIRVDADAMKRQLALAGCPERAELPFQKAILNEELPYTIGGGIGQSRLCMYFLRKAHIGEVQASVWPQEMIEQCADHHIYLL